MVHGFNMDVAACGYLNRDRSIFQTTTSPIVDQEAMANQRIHRPLEADLWYFSLCPLNTSDQRPTQSKSSGRKRGCLPGENPSDLWHPRCFLKIVYLVSTSSYDSLILHLLYYRQSDSMQTGLLYLYSAGLHITLIVETISTRAVIGRINDEEMYWVTELVRKKGNSCNRELLEQNFNGPWITKTLISKLTYQG